MEMRIRNLEGRCSHGYTTWGCVWDKGTLKNLNALVLKNSDNAYVAMQSRVTAWWPDGSIKWTAHTAEASLMGECAVVAAEADNKVYLRQTERQIKVCEDENGWRIDNSFFNFYIPKSGRNIFENVKTGGKEVITFADCILLLEERIFEKGGETRITRQYAGSISKVSIVEKGPLQLVVKYEGIHVRNDVEKIPFVIYMKLGLGDSNFKFTHTFFYDGDEDRDFLKGIGVRFNMPVKGGIYNRHVKFQGDYGFMHEAAALLLGGKKFSWSVYEDQMNEICLGDDYVEIDKVKESIEFFPYWDTYEFYQDSASHFAVRKKIKDENCCYLDCLSGNRTKGGASFGSENGSFAFAIRDFWEKYPSGYTFKGLSSDMAEAVVWFYAPQAAEAMDFRHYANTGYSQVYYEGYPFKGADPKGIACTSEMAAGYFDKIIPSDAELYEFSNMVDKPAQYVGNPEYYHDRKAFGAWSLVNKDTKVREELENWLEYLTEFYMNETEKRNWYGMFNYGDIMHRYDSYRHVWRYDMGGFAWDNTELVPTYWIWYMFLRTGREDIFSFGERLTRHTSEVDVYHMGPLKGLGSRHNVRHWGCPCKEIRVAMAGHHRFYYYLTGDYRLGDIFDNFADAENALLYKDPMGEFFDKEKMVFPTHARSGPDWSSLCANWMTSWERHKDEGSLNKIRTGIEDISKAPLKLISGTDFEFDPDTCHLRYIGERATGGSHLQICMGAAQIWMELADLLEDEEWKEMLVSYGEFYFLDSEEKLNRTNGLIGKRGFSFPFFAAAIGAYAAAERKDAGLAEHIWQCMFKELYKDGECVFKENILENTANHKNLREIKDLSTNTVAQWCLNTIVCLDLIEEYLPEKIQN